MIETVDMQFSDPESIAALPTGTRFFNVSLLITLSETEGMVMTGAMPLTPAVLERIREFCSSHSLDVETMLPTFAAELCVRETWATGSKVLSSLEIDRETLGVQMAAAAQERMGETRD